MWKTGFFLVIAFFQSQTILGEMVNDTMIQDQVHNIFNSLDANSINLFISGEDVGLELHLHLSGGQSACIDFPAHGFLSAIDTSIAYTPPQPTGDEWMSDMALVVKNSAGGTQIGGYLSFQLVSGFPKGASWPTAWDVPNAGIYSTTQQMSEFSIDGADTYTVCVGNGWNFGRSVVFDGTLIFTGLKYDNNPFTWSNVCSFSQYHTLRNQIAEKVASNTQKLSSIAGINHVVCTGECVPFLQVEAAQSLHKIMSTYDKGRMILEAAYQGPVEEFLLSNWTTDGSNPCSHREWKNLHEDPVKDNHEGCSIDVSIRDVSRWSDILISKGWMYSRPTIDKHHFEFLKCGETPSSSEGVTAFQQLWNEANTGSLSGGTLDNATSAALNEMLKTDTTF